MNSVNVPHAAFVAAQAAIVAHQQATLRVPCEAFNRPGMEDIVVAYPDGGGNWIGWSRDSVGRAEFTLQAYPFAAGFPCPAGRPGELVSLQCADSGQQVSARVAAVQAKRESDGWWWVVTVATST